jgi:hypothetical protein
MFRKSEHGLPEDPEQITNHEQIRSERVNQDWKWVPPEHTLPPHQHELYNCAHTKTKILFHHHKVSPMLRECFRRGGQLQLCGIRSRSVYKE